MRKLVAYSAKFLCSYLQSLRYSVPIEMPSKLTEIKIQRVLYQLATFAFNGHPNVPALTLYQTNAS